MLLTASMEDVDQMHESHQHILWVYYVTYSILTFSHYNSFQRLRVQESYICLTMHLTHWSHVLSTKYWFSYWHNINRTRWWISFSVCNVFPEGEFEGEILSEPHCFSAFCLINTYEVFSTMWARVSFYLSKRKVFLNHRSSLVSLQSVFFLLSFCPFSEPECFNDNIFHCWLQYRCLCWMIPSQLSISWIKIPTGCILSVCLIVTELGK